MELSTLCILGFCVNVLLDNNYQSYNRRLKLENLDYETTLTLHNLTYLHEAVEYNIKVRIEGVIRNTIIVASHVALDKISAQSRVAKREGKEARSCSDKHKKQVLHSASQGAHRLTVCLAQLQHEYVELLKNIKTAKENAQLLRQKLLSFETNCLKDKGDRESCLDRIVRELTQKQAESQYLYDKYYALYNIMQKLMPRSLKGIDGMAETVGQELNNILKQSHTCMSDLPRLNSTLV